MGACRNTVMDQIEEVKYILDRLNVGQFRTIPPHVAQFSQEGLIVLRLNNKAITEIPVGIFDRLRSLKVLDLSGNYLTKLPQRCFSKLESLEELHLSNNQLTVLDFDLLSGLSKLEELNLQFNSLETLDDRIFYPIQGLKTLNLSNNQLASVPKSLQSLSYLEWIDLSENNLPANHNRNIFLLHRTQEFLQKII